MNKPRVIAEIGCNHLGKIELAKELIAVAAYYCKADAVKFQKRDVDTWTERYPKMYKAPHPNEENSYGKTYEQHRKALEFNIDQHRELMEYCNDIGIVYSTSVWDTISAKEISSLNPTFIKIPSACNTNEEMLSWLCDNYQGEIQISTGMTTKEELNNIVKLFSQKKRNQDLVLFNCTSGYPVPYEDISLLEIPEMIESFGDKVKEIAFSGHHIGTAIDVAAYALGATTIERHYTLDKTWKGTDHAASLEPDEIKKLVYDLKCSWQALRKKDKEILDIEEIQRKKLKWI